MPDAPIRVLVAKPGLDGHDRGAKVIARALRDAGYEVIYTGLRQTPEQIVSAAIQEDVEVIGLSVLSGAHIPLTEKIMAQLEAQGARDKVVIVGGTILSKDVERLKAMGVEAVFPTGSSLSAPVDFLRERFAPAG